MKTFSWQDIIIGFSFRGRRNFLTSPEIMVIFISFWLTALPLMADVSLIRFCDRKNTFRFMVISNLPDIVVFISSHTFGLYFSPHSLQIFVDRSARPYAPCPRLTILSHGATWEVLCTSVNCHTLLAHTHAHAHTTWPYFIGRFTAALFQFGCLICWRGGFLIRARSAAAAAWWTDRQTLGPPLTRFTATHLLYAFM